MYNAFIMADDVADDDVDMSLRDYDTTIPDVVDPYEKVYENVPSKTHMLQPVENCEHCNANKLESEPPGFLLP